MRRIVYHEIGAYRRVLGDPARRQYAAWDARIKYADNDSGELSITIAPENPEYQTVASLASELVVEDDGVEIWRGRVYDQTVDIYDCKTIIAKGVLDYLHDTIQPAQTFNGSVSDLFSAVIASHNGKPIEAHKRFGIGTLAVTDTVTDYKISAGANTWTVLSGLIKTYGGHIRVRRVNEKNYIDWLAEITDICSQPIRLGANLLDLTQKISNGDLSTVVYAYGKSTDGIPLSISAVNDGLPYVVDTEAVALFGWIESSYTDSSCDDAQKLKSDAKKALQERINEAKTIKVSAADLSDIGDAERIAINMLVPVLAPAKGIDELMPCTTLERYLWEPQRTKISLGVSTRALSAMIGGSL